MLKPSLLFIAGGLAAQHTTPLLRSDLLSLLLVASICAVGVPRLRLLACCIVGFVLFQLAGARIIDDRLAPRYAGDSMLAVLRIADFPQQTGDRLVLTVTPLDDTRIPERVRVSWFEAPVVPRIGEVWELELRPRRPRGSFNPGAFDYESWLFRERIHATGYVVPGHRNRLLWAGTESSIDRFRGAFVARAQEAARTPEQAAVLSAIGVGARHTMTRAQWDRFAVTGTSHLMAISGLHVGLAALAGSLCFFSLAAVWPSRGNHYVGAIWFGVAVAAGYALVSGFGVPARRAVLMLVLTALAVAGRRQVLPATVVGVTAAIVFAIDPVSSLSPGFNLSFAAVIVLLWLARRRPGGRLRFIGPAIRLVGMQIFLMFGLAPLTALLFGRFAVLATPANLLAVPMFSFLTVPLTLAAVAIGSAWETGSGALLGLAATTVGVVDGFLYSASVLPFAHAWIAKPEGIGWLFLVLPAAWVVLPRAWPGRPVAIIGLMALLAWKPAPPPAACFDAWVLDAGQGLAVAIQTQNGMSLYDTGVSWRDGSSVAERVILPFLRARGTDRVTHLVVSHADLDHSGGVGVLLGHVDVRHIIAGEPLPGIDTRACRRGLSWQSGQVRFDIVYPGAEATLDGNDASCVLRVSVGRHALLLTGDIEARAERSLLQSGASLAADVAVVPHHGSLTSSSSAFIAAVSPELAIVSAAFRNRWQFPRPQVVARWESAAARVMNTATSGAVHTRLCAGAGLVAIDAERERRRRFWHAEPH